MWSEKLEKFSKIYAEQVVKLPETSSSKTKRPKILELREFFLHTPPIKDNLLYHEGEAMFYLYDEERFFYSVLSEKELKALIDKFILTFYTEQSSSLDTTKHLIEEVFESLVRYSGPAIQKIHGSKHSTVSSFLDGQFDFKTLEFSPHNKKNPSFHSFSFSFPHSPLLTPSFDKYLETTFVKEDGSPDPELVDFMISSLAFYISPINYEPFSLFLLGSGANGKSVFLDLLINLIGDEFMSALTMETLSSRFGMAGLIGKRLNCVSEDQSKYINPGRVKALISQEIVEVEKKYSDISKCRFTAKHIFSSNKEIKFEDVDRATTRRIAVVKFNRTFEPEKDDSIDNVLILPRDRNLLGQKEGEYYGKLLDELPGIFYKLVERLKILREDDYYFPFPSAVKISQQSVESASSTALEFFWQHYEIDKEYPEFISTEEMYNKYQNWYKQIYPSCRYLLTPRSFQQTLTKNLPSTVTKEKFYSQTLKKTTAVRRFIKEKEEGVFDYLTRSFNISSKPDIPF